MTGAGKSAQVENIGFFKTTDNLISNQSGGSGLPELYYIAPNVNWKKYKNVIVPDFTSMTSDISKISGLQISDFKNLRQDIPDNIARSLDGSVFQKCVRSDQRIDPNDTKEIKGLKADAILFGNISECKTGTRIKSGGMLVSTQVEIKLVDRKTGQEIIKIIDRRSTDSDKISMPIVRYLANVMKAANQNALEKK